MGSWLKIEAIHRPRLLAAIFLAPLFSVVAMAAYLPFFGGEADSAKLEALDIAFSILVLSNVYVNGLLAAILVGLPVYFAQQSKRRHRGAVYVLAGCIAGSVINVKVLSAILLSEQSEMLFGTEPSNLYVVVPQAILSSLFPFGLLGAGSGAIFYWTLASRKNVQ